MRFDRRARLGIRRDVHAPLPHLDGLVPEAGFFVEDREVLQRGKMLRIEVDGTLELRDSVVDLALLPVNQRQVIAETVREGIDNRL